VFDYFTKINILDHQPLGSGIAKNFGLDPSFVRNWFLVGKGFTRGSLGVDKVFSRGWLGKKPINDLNKTFQIPYRNLSNPKERTNKTGR